MKNTKYKIYKQIGIQEFVPFKLNVKLFKQLIIAKLIFIYFFTREQVNKKYKNLRAKFQSYSKYNKYYIFKNFNLDKIKHFNLYKIKNISNETQFYNKLKSYITTIYHFKNNKKQNRKYNNSIKWIKKKLKKGNKFFTKRTKPFKFNFNSINLNLFKQNYNNRASISTWRNSNIFELISNSRLLYLKLNSYKKIYIFNYLILRKLHLKYKKIYITIFNLFKKQLVYLMFLILAFKYSKYKYIFHKKSILTYKKLIFKIKKTFIHLKKKKLLIFFIIFYKTIQNYQYILRYKKEKRNITYLFKDCFKNNKSLIELKNNKTFWIFLAQFFFFKDYELKKKKPFFKFRFTFNNIYRFLYKKYIAELSRSQMFLKFIYSILNYKQKKQTKQFFIQMYRKKYFKQKYSQFHNINSYYKTQKTILFLLNNKKNKSRRTTYHFKKSMIRLFQIKVGKLLYQVKKTKNYFKILNFLKRKYLNPNLLNNLSYSNISYIFESIYKLNYKTIDLLKLKDKIRINNSSQLNQLNLLTYIPELGDTFRISNIDNFKFYFRKTFLYFLHFYFIIISLFLNRKLNLFQSFGYFRFFLKILLYKLSYIIIYHVNNNKYKRKKLKFLKLKRQLFIFDSRKDQYEVISLTNISAIYNTQPIYLKAPYSLEKARIDAFYKLKFKKKKVKLKMLRFLNFFNKLSFYKKMKHNQFHIMRYYNFIKTLKKNILSFLQHNFMYNKKTILFVNVHSNYTDLIIHQTHFFKNNINNYLSNLNFNLNKSDSNTMLNHNNYISYKYAH